MNCKEQIKNLCNRVLQMERNEITIALSLLVQTRTDITQAFGFWSREMFNKWQAQRWWGENYDRIMELYNVQRFNQQALHTPPRSEDEVNLFYLILLLKRFSRNSISKFWVNVSSPVYLIMKCFFIIMFEPPPFQSTEGWHFLLNTFFFNLLCIH